MELLYGGPRGTEVQYSFGGLPIMTCEHHGTVTERCNDCKSRRENWVRAAEQAKRRREYERERHHRLRDPLNRLSCWLRLGHADELVGLFVDDIPVNQGSWEVTRATLMHDCIRCGRRKFRTN